MARRLHQSFAQCQELPFGSRSPNGSVILHPQLLFCFYCSAGGQVGSLRCAPNCETINPEGLSRLDGRQSSPQIVQQCPCPPQIRGVEPLDEPAIDWSEEVAGFGTAALVVTEPGEAHGGAQFPELGFLLLGYPEGFAIEFLGGLGMPLPQQQLTFVPVQFSREPALPCPFDDLQSIVRQGQRLFSLPCDLTCLSEEGDVLGHKRLGPGRAVSGRTAPQ